MNNTFQAMGKAIPSLILSISRQGLIFIPVLFIANSVLGLLTYGLFFIFVYFYVSRNVINKIKM
ncbi:MAG: hypothetical protein IJ086_05580 [Clostridium sp.]|nr:hypothetical protein [Clostridium sp.]